MYYNNHGELISISYPLWVRKCVRNNHAFVIEPSSDITDEEERKELLFKLGTLFDETYPDRHHIWYFPVVKSLGRNLYSDEIAFAIRDRTLSYVLTEKDLEILTRKISRKPVFTITDAKDYKPQSDIIHLLSIPQGCPWIPQCSF